MTACKRFNSNGWIKSDLSVRIPTKGCDVYLKVQLTVMSSVICTLSLFNNRYPRLALLRLHSSLSRIRSQWERQLYLLAVNSGLFVYFLRRTNFHLLLFINDFFTDCQSVLLQQAFHRYQLLIFSHSYTSKSSLPVRPHIATSIIGAQNSAPALFL